MINRLFIDIETSPNVGVFWKTGRELYLGPENIIRERGIICVCWKWEGDTKVHSVDWGQQQDDRRVVRRMAELINAADEVVAHNGASFDLPWIRGRCLKAGVPLSPHVVMQDTYRLSRRLFNLNNHSLAYLGSYLGLGGKLSTGGLSLWIKVTLDKCKQSLAKMVEYCKRDITLLEDVWTRIQPYAPARSHATGNISECPECGSKKLHVSKYRTTAAGHKQVQLCCKDCGKYQTVAASRWHKAVIASITARAKQK